MSEHHESYYISQDHAMRYPDLLRLSAVPQSFILCATLTLSRASYLHLPPRFTYGIHGVSLELTNSTNALLR